MLSGPADAGWAPQGEAFNCPPRCRRAHPAQYIGLYHSFHSRSHKGHIRYDMTFMIPSDRGAWHTAYKTGLSLSLQTAFGPDSPKQKIGDDNVLSFDHASFPPEKQAKLLMGDPF